jgi:hypothetical protein
MPKRPPDFILMTAPSNCRRMILPFSSNTNMESYWPQALEALHHPWNCSKRVLCLESWNCEQPNRSATTRENKNDRYCHPNASDGPSSKPPRGARVGILGSGWEILDLACAAAEAAHPNTQKRRRNDMSTIAFI